MRIRDKGEMGVGLKLLAEREGFEPPLPVRVNLISSPFPTVTQTNQTQSFPKIPSQFCLLSCGFLVIVGTSSRTFLGQCKSGAFLEKVKKSTPQTSIVAVFGHPKLVIQRLFSLARVLPLMASIAKRYKCENEGTHCRGYVRFAIASHHANGAVGVCRHFGKKR